MNYLLSLGVIVSIIAIVRGVTKYYFGIKNNNRIDDEGDDFMIL